MPKRTIYHKFKKFQKEEFIMNKLNAKARVSEVDGFSDTLVRLYKADSAAQTDAFLKTEMAELESLSDKITAAILQDKAVSNLDEADSARDEAIRNLGALISGYAVFPLEEKKNAALSLKSIYDKYQKSGILGATYTAESSMIESMLGDFGTAEAVANIEKLDGVSDLVSKVRSAQDAFTAANDAFTKSKSAKGESASSLKKPLLSSINDKIIPYLNTMAMVGNAALSGFSKNVEAEVNRLNSTVGARSK